MWKNEKQKQNRKYKRTYADTNTVRVVNIREQDSVAPDF